MSFAFATCDRRRALQFLQKLYPSKQITDTPESAGPLLDFVEADVVRITDPDFHRGEVIQSKNWDDLKSGAVMDACMRLNAQEGAA